MSKAVSCLVFSMVLTTGLAGQSGRRTTTDPTPTPTPSPRGVSAAPSLPYSESVPRPPRARSTAVIQNEKLAAPITVGDEDTVKVETSLVTIPVSVFDRNGLY